MAKEHMLQANMDQNQNGQPGGGNAHGKNQIVAPQTGSGGSAFSAYPARREEQQQQQQHYSPTFIHHHLKQQDLQQALDKFWETQLKEIEETDPSEMFKSHCLPLARIKKIMKADEDVRMISAEAPVLFAKACEMFIMELTMRAWVNAEENKRRTLQKSDIASAVSGTDVFDFLVDVVPRDDTMEHEVFVGIPKQEPVAGNNNVTYYVPMPPVPNYHHQHHAAAGGGGGGAGPSSSYGAPLGRPMFDHARYRQHHPRAFGTHVLPIPRLQRNHSPNSDDSDNDD